MTLWCCDSRQAPWVVIKRNLRKHNSPREKQGKMMKWHPANRTVDEITRKEGEAAIL